MTDTCSTNTNSCGCQKGYRCALVAMIGSGYFLFLAANAFMQSADRHLRQGVKWNQLGVIDAVTTAAMAVFALLVLVDAVRSFRSGTLGKIAFFGVLMLWSVVLTMVLFYLLLTFAPSFV